MNVGLVKAQLFLIKIFYFLVVISEVLLLRESLFLLTQWYMVTIVHIYNRWKNSELRCYVNGELASYGEITWLVNTSDVSSFRNVPSASGFLFCDKAPD